MAATMMGGLRMCMAQGAKDTKDAKEPKAIRMEAARVEPLVGQYALVDEPESVLSFSLEGEHFYVESRRVPRAEVKAESVDHFFIPGSKVRFVFSHGPDGKADGVKRSIGSETSEARKVSDHPVRNRMRPYDRKEVMIPMRDGVKLHAVILRPTDAKGMSAPLPFLIQRTPYGVDGSTSDSINGRYTELAESGYIFVMADIRGRYESEGKFVMCRPVVHAMGNRTDPKLVDESSDAYDTVEWLLRNVPNNNGRVGVLGTSYPGFLAIMAGIDPHPAVKAISPQAPMTDTWLGDDFFHNGAFRQTYGFDYVKGMESAKESTFEKLNEDAYDYFLKNGSFAGAAKAGGVAELPTGRAFLEHPAYDGFWKAMAVQPLLTQVTVPTLEVGGWWDQEDMWGPQAEYAALKPHDSKHEVFLVLGPWNHGGWARTTRHLGSGATALDFGEATTDEYRAQIEAPFFAKYLKDEPGFNLKDTAAYETGSNRWQRYDVWPPVAGIQKKELYLAAEGGLSFGKPAADSESAFTAYESDPANPVPYRKRPVEATYAPGGSGWYTWLVEDQRKLADRKDVVRWQTEVLDKDVTIAGDVNADIYASTSGTDSDWVVKLIDVYPDEEMGKPHNPMVNFQLMIADEIFRGRYRTSFEKPEAIPADTVEEYKWSLHGADHTFLKGHRIMVEVQSSWFPLYDRNPQKFVPNIMTAEPGDYQKATEKIYWSSKYPSHVTLPVKD